MPAIKQDFTGGTFVSQYTIVLKSKLLSQVAAQTGHKVTLVDISQDVLDKSAARIGESIKRVAKKEYKDDQVRS